ncbi:hypothetical protein HMPREF1531_00631 [Propionibacterium sp. oral taxon 192 str. F0372]|uniref:Gfo/Idh/MocA family protein n=1 Tax=Propionibacterium sp. oral taxon 192 TaxID=671222 RepID=UPI0003544DB2|nr:Gfo/Idh/MocA family oxidoreductase [Propionibacterium sp. oral taxon 192]EPH05983.1 hypothetical protein HMPREF1531_00631 [Propionibacterium sp. oral taxon 192 str. F0372]
MANLRAGLIGLGAMGRNHARNLRALDGVDLVIVADPDDQRLADQNDCLTGHCVDDVIAAGVDYCVVATPTDTHEQIGIALAEANVHALIEKPLATDTAAALRLSQAFASHGLVGGVGHIERFNAALQNLRIRLAAGQLGEMYQIVTRRQGPYPGRIKDVGVILDLASHDIDLTAWVSQRHYQQVTAHTVSKSCRHVEDMVSATCRLSDGLISNHLVNWLTPTKERRTIITGERGMFVADTLTSDLTFYDNGQVYETWGDVAQFGGVAEGDVVRYAIPKPEPLRIEHEQFRDAILDKPGAQVVTMAEGVKVVMVCEAMMASDGNTITVNTSSTS